MFSINLINISPKILNLIVISKYDDDVFTAKPNIDCLMNFPV